ncbi:MAG: SRPBCC family protein [Elainellaceae cyanobacterium]
MLHYERSILINAPLPMVWEFHERPDILDLLTPPWQPIEVVRREGGLGVGAESEFRLYLGLLPVRWLARHTAYDHHRLFTDEQVEGPFDHWIHRHEFRDEQGQTRLTDAIAYSLPFGSVADPLFGWAVQANLDQLFQYRHRVTRQECERWR